MAASMSATRLLHASVLASCAIALQPTAKLVVVKYGGHCMTDEAGFARDVVALQQTSAVVVVHGGGPQIRRMLRRLGPGATRDVVEVAEMVLGRIGKNLAAAIGAAGGRACMRWGILRVGSCPTCPSSAYVVDFATSRRRLV